MSIDAAFYVLTGPHGRNRGSIGRTFVFMAIGTVFLGFGLRWFGWQWCTIVGALERQKTSSDPTLKPNSARFRIACRTIKVLYDLVAVLNLPVALVIAICTTEVGATFGLDHDKAKKMWIVWIFLSACVAFTINSVVMTIVVQRYMDCEINGGGIGLVTKLNLAEQLIYNLCLGLAGLLYALPAYNAHGAVQGLVYSLLALVAWMMHAQVFAFYCVTKPDDPLYSEKALHGLLNDEKGDVAPESMETGSAAQTPPPPQFAVPLQDGWTAHWDEGSENMYYYQSSTGLSQWEIPSKAASAAPEPAKIGSPQLESATAKTMPDNKVSSLLMRQGTDPEQSKLFQTAYTESI
jgi:hypothetical protein